MIKTSVIVPVYNTQPYLEECFNSIFSQTQKEIEVIAVNDGSVDGSLQELEKIKKDHQHLIIINQQNQGPGEARNAGVKIAKGEYVYFCDSDDYLCDNSALKKCYQYAVRNQLDIVMFDAKLCGNKCSGKNNFYDRRNIIETQYETVCGKEFIIKNFEKTFCPSPDLVYIKNSFLLENDIYFLKDIFYEDALFHCELMMHAKKVMYLPEIYYARRYRENSIMTSVFGEKNLKDRLTIAEKISKLQSEKDVRNTFHRIAVNILKVVLELGIQSKLFDNSSNANLMCETSRKICQKDSFREIDILFQSSVLSNHYDLELEKRRNCCLEKLFENLMFDNENIMIGIYGIGKETERLFNEYETFAGQIKAKLVFIVTNPNGTCFRGQKIVGLADIESMDLEYILIASSVYEFEMEKSIEELFGNKFKVIKLYSDLYF